MNFDYLEVAAPRGLVSRWLLARCASTLPSRWKRFTAFKLSVPPRRSISVGGKVSPKDIGKEDESFLRIVLIRWVSIDRGERTRGCESRCPGTKRRTETGTGTGMGRGIRRSWKRENRRTLTKKIYRFFKVSAYRLLERSFFQVNHLPRQTRSHRLFSTINTRNKHKALCRRVCALANFFLCIYLWNSQAHRAPCFLGFAILLLNYFPFVLYFNHLR